MILFGISLHKKIFVTKKFVIKIYYGIKCKMNNDTNFEKNLFSKRNKNSYLSYFLKWNYIFFLY